MVPGWPGLVPDCPDSYRGLSGFVPGLSGLVPGWSGSSPAYPDPGSACSIRILLGRKLCHQRLRISIHQQIVFVFAELIGLDAGLRLQPFQRQIRFESVRQFPVRLQKVVERIQGNAGVTVNQRDVEPLVEVEPRAANAILLSECSKTGIRSGRGRRWPCS